ncbi:AraC family transcriptional regulator [Clostridioides difficile]|uniref:AraC family transcriptional regulator n=1 Tax=Clostridioides difficile TaxID=1496 RepID=UPI00202F7658|nr:helix-turn-helix domain-containing protein [Clostridioides difficile]MCM0747448.1 AraC family transcriptional regulator [Clostridioides difficile]
MYAYETIEKSLNYIEQHLNEKIETEELAEIACLSTFYYQHLFKKLVKKPVQEYIKLRRLAMVITELNNSKERILDIALKYGFSDHANFTRAFKEVYHITPDEYRKNVPLLNTFDKPELSSKYIMIDENVPLIVGNIVLEIQRKVIKDDETYLGFEKEVAISEQIPMGESTGIDIPGQLWQEFHTKKLQSKNINFSNDIELGLSYLANHDKETFLYFAGGMASPTAIYPKNMVQRTLPAGEYVICHIEAETFEELITTALNQANKYLFETWLPNHQLTTKPFMAEKYYKGNKEVNCMEIWVIPLKIEQPE